ASLTEKKIPSRVRSVPCTFPSPRIAYGMKESPPPSLSTTNQSPPEPLALPTDDSASLVVGHSPDVAMVDTTIPLGTDVVTIGRDVDGGVRFADSQLSRVHFRIAYDGRARAHRIGDARSRNGTLVDGAKIESVVLREGAVVRAGETVFVYRT